ncbi:MAG: nucleotidyltransferase domain-containing protein [Phycisphaerae bacterium]|jgi:predicted nucleotidyltransferase
MNPIIANREKELADLCRRFHVARIEAFGSVTTDEFDEQQSDLDFLVDFTGGVAGRQFESFFGLHRALSELFDRPVDLVEEGASRNPCFIRRLDESRRVIYAA